MNVEWRKSSRSAGQGQCVEVAALPGWRKSSRSVGEGQCVEVAALPGQVLVRDSKHPEGPVLSFTASEWRAFLGAADSGAKGGEFDI